MANGHGGFEPAPAPCVLPARPLLPPHTHTLTLATATRTHNTDIKAKRNQAPAARKAARDAAVRAVKEAKKSKKGGKKK